MNPISEKLIAWYELNQRDLPWRRTKDAYRIWLSEIIMQQTQVIQGLSYYNKFTARYPDVLALAHAPGDEVMRLWQGLGYYSRARNLHTAAKHVASHHAGKFPSDYKDIRFLKGVGDYTAAAIASFAYDLPYAVVDGNVYRVLSRLFGIATPINSPAGKKEFQALADELLDKKRPALHNSAMMEFGALHCRPQNPLCDTCVVRELCYAHSHQQVQDFPVKEKKLKIRERYLAYIVLKHHNKVYIRKRTAKDIWQNLYEFYPLESEARQGEEQVLNHPWLRTLGTSFSLELVSKEYKHVLTHRVIYATFYVLNLEKLPVHHDMMPVTAEELDSFGLPRLIHKFLQDYPVF